MYATMDEDQGRRNFFSGFAGILFGIGWWVFIDAVASSRASDAEIVVLVDSKQYLPGIGATLAWIMIVGMDWGALSADSFTYSGSNVSGKATCFLGFALLMALGSLIGAIAIIVDLYDKPCNTGDSGSSCMWPGIAILLQTIFIMLSTFIMRCSIPVE
jgi:hypothetical protein